MRTRLSAPELDTKSNDSQHFPLCRVWPTHLMMRQEGTQLPILESANDSRREGGANRAGWS